jgi:hypothetical protein
MEGRPQEPNFRLRHFGLTCWWAIAYTQGVHRM